MKFALVLMGLALAACSSSTPKVDAPKTAPAAPKSVSADEAAGPYSITQLNSAANLLKVVVDEAGTTPNKDVGSDLIGCGLTGKQASTMTMPLKSLMDPQVRTETDAYVTDPKNFATEKGFEACAAQCACGVLSDVVEGATAEAFTSAAATKMHERNRTKLRVKAAHQTARDSLACARTQTWFCTSGLKTYLEQQAKENASEN